MNPESLLSGFVALIDVELHVGRAWAAINLCVAIRCVPSRCGRDVWSQVMNVLIADDDKTFAQLLAAELRERGCRVTIASDAMQAVMFAVRAPQDVIILDVQM